MASLCSKRTAPLWRVVLVAVLSFGLLLVSFGHRPAQAEAQAYILAGGDWADLCADGDNPHPASDRCMACVVAQGADLQGPVTTEYPVHTARALRWTMQSVVRPATTAALTHPARAPPVADRSILI